MPLSLRNETEYPPGGAVIKTKSRSLFPDLSNSKPPPSASLGYAFINSDITSNAHNPLFNTSFFFHQVQQLAMIPFLLDLERRFGLYGQDRQNGESTFPFSKCLFLH